MQVFLKLILLINVFIIFQTVMLTMGMFFKPRGKGFRAFYIFASEKKSSTPTIPFFDEI